MVSRAVLELELDELLLVVTGMVLELDLEELLLVV